MFLARFSCADVVYVLYCLTLPLPLPRPLAIIMISSLVDWSIRCLVIDSVLLSFHYLPFLARETKKKEITSYVSPPGPFHISPRVPSALASTSAHND